MDLAAKGYLKECRKEKRPFKPIQLKYEYWAVYCKGVKQSNIHPEKLRTDFPYQNNKLLEHPPLYSCLFAVQHSPRKKANRLARRKLTPAKRRFVSKFCTSCIGVGHTLEYRQWQNHARSPCCGLKKKEPTMYYYVLTAEQKERTLKKLLRRFWNQFWRKCIRSQNCHPRYLKLYVAGVTNKR